MSFLFIPIISLLHEGDNSDGMHADVHIMDIDDSESDKPKEKRDPTADIKHFFKPMAHTPGSKSGQSRCNAC